MTENNPKILIVDDISDNIQVAANILKEGKLNITFAKSGKAAFQKLRKIDVDLILLDIMMPEMDGYEVCRILKNEPNWKHIPVIFLTAKTEPENIARGFAVGGVDYIIKPFNSRELICRVQNHLRLCSVTRQLQKANETRDKLFSIISHDLRGHMGNIKNVFEALTSNYFQLDSNRARRLVELGKDSSAFTYNLLENLLCWARSEQGLIKYKPKLCNINLLIEETLELYSATAKHKKLTVKFSPVSENRAFFDEDMIKAVFRNLLSNAVKFSPEDSEIQVAIKHTDFYLKLSIIDQGEGIDLGILRRILRKELQFSNKGTLGEEGTGLGLILIKYLIDQNFGKLLVESNSAGSKFTVILPKSAVVTQQSFTIPNDNMIHNNLLMI